MSKGYPDFFGMSTFQQFGSFQNETAVSILDGPVTDYEVLRITGKGKIYSGNIRLTSIVDPNFAVPKIVIDGDTFNAYALQAIHYWGDLKPTASLLEIQAYLVEDQVYALSIMGGITFVDSFVVLIDYPVVDWFTVAIEIGWAKVV